MHRRTFLLLFLLILAGSARASSADPKGFSSKDNPGQHLDILLDGRRVACYMYAHDNSTKQLREETTKPPSTGR